MNTMNSLRAAHPDYEIDALAADDIVGSCKAHVMGWRVGVNKC